MLCLPTGNQAANGQLSPLSPNGYVVISSIDTDMNMDMDMEIDMKG